MGRRKHYGLQIRQSFPLPSASREGWGTGGRGTRSPSGERECPPPCPRRRARAGRRVSALKDPETEAGPGNAHVPGESTHTRPLRPHVHTLRADGWQKGSDQASPPRPAPITRARSPSIGVIHEHAHGRAHMPMCRRPRVPRVHVCGGPRVPAGPGSTQGRGCRISPGLSGSAARTGRSRCGTIG